LAAVDLASRILRRFSHRHFGAQQLFTENTLTVILPLLLETKLNTLVLVLRLWAVVIAANLAVTFLFALCIGHAAIFSDQIRQSLYQIGLEHLGSSFGIVLLRAIFAEWLIALMLWLLPGAEQSRVVIIIIITYLVGLAGFNHIVAGSTTMFFLVVTKRASWEEFGTHRGCMTVLLPSRDGSG
jgi:formate-nitrite transporter family protein